MDGSVDFFRGWNDYVSGFGDMQREFWLGKEMLFSYPILGATSQLYVMTNLKFCHQSPQIYKKKNSVDNTHGYSVISNARKATKQLNST